MAVALYPPVGKGKIRKVSAEGVRVVPEVIEYEVAYDTTVLRIRCRAMEPPAKYFCVVLREGEEVPVGFNPPKLDEALQYAFTVMRRKDVLGRVEDELNRLVRKETKGKKIEILLD